jgi:hypothetical protein
VSSPRCRAEPVSTTPAPAPVAERGPTSSPGVLSRADPAEDWRTHLGPEGSQFAASSPDFAPCQDPAMSGPEVVRTGPIRSPAPHPPNVSKGCGISLTPAFVPAQVVQRVLEWAPPGAPPTATILLPSLAIERHRASKALVPVSPPEAGPGVGVHPAGTSRAAPTLTGTMPRRRNAAGHDLPWLKRPEPAVKNTPRTGGRLTPQNPIKASDAATKARDGAGHACQTTPDGADTVTGTPWGKAALAARRASPSTEVRLAWPPPFSFSTGPPPRDIMRG